MSNVLYEKGREAIGNGTVIWTTDNIKVVLVDLDDYGKIITAATNATPIVVTSASHGYANGDVVSISYVAGNTAANGRFRVANVATNTFELTNYDTGANVAGNGAYTSGGYAVKTSGALNLSDITAGARVATSGNLASKTNTDGVFDAADVTFTAVTGDPSEALVIYKDSGVAGTSTLIALIDTATGMRVTPNSGDITVAWANTGNPWGNTAGILKI